MDQLSSAAIAAMAVAASGPWTFRWLIMFAPIRIAYFCLVAFCSSCIFVNAHQVRASVALSDSSLDLARSRLVSPNLDILPHRALPPAEPFNLRSIRVSTEITAQWSELQSRISADEKALAACRSGERPCSQAELQFWSIVELARKQEARARLGWLNRAVNMSIKPVSDGPNMVIPIIGHPRFKHSPVEPVTARTMRS